ncbi:MAG: hypothetical protein EOP83_16110 [Verrucomicrobiaceae bacterium]|nr:MAG: hypothetical protein EOP83_16110 [Verrucomicrobiaceae bacterium]
MKLSRNTIIGLSLALAAIVFAAVVSSRSTSDQEDAASNGVGGSTANFSDSASGSLSQRRATRPELVNSKVLAARELEMLWAPGRGQELIVQLDRVSANKDPEYWREIGPLLVKHASSEGRPEVANYLLVTSDAAPDTNLRIEVYAAALDNRDKGIQTTARLELENMTGQQFKTGADARAWLTANPQPVEVEEEMPEDQ